MRPGGLLRRKNDSLQSLLSTPGLLGTLLGIVVNLALKLLDGLDLDKIHMKGAGDATISLPPCSKRITREQHRFKRFRARLLSVALEGQHPLGDAISKGETTPDNQWTHPEARASGWLVLLLASGFQWSTTMSSILTEISRTGDGVSKPSCRRHKLGF